MESTLTFITLSDGLEVKLLEHWNCCDGCNDCGSVLDIYDADTDELLGSIEGMTIPDFEDEDENFDDFYNKIEEEVYGI